MRHSWFILPIDIDHPKRIDERKIGSDCIKLFAAYRTIFICVIYSKDRLKTKKEERKQIKLCEKQSKIESSFADGFAKGTHFEKSSWAYDIHADEICGNGRPCAHSVYIHSYLE